MKLKKGDTVVVIAGKDKNKTGEIESVIPARNKVIVTGVNLVKRHQKATKAGQAPGIIVKAMPIDASNVMLVEKGKPVRTGHRINADGTKVRVSRRTGEEV